MVTLHDMLTFVQSIRTSKVNAILACFLLLINRKQDNVCEMERQWPTPLGTARFATQDMLMMAQIIPRVRRAPATASIGKPTIISLCPNPPRRKGHV